MLVKSMFKVNKSLLIPQQILLKIIGSEERLLIQKPRDHTSVEDYDVDETQILETMWQIVEDYDVDETQILETMWQISVTSNQRHRQI